MCHGKREEGTVFPLWEQGTHSGQWDCSQCIHMLSRLPRPLCIFFVGFLGSGDDKLQMIPPLSPFKHRDYITGLHGDAQLESHPNTIRFVSVL